MAAIRVTTRQLQAYDRLVNKWKFHELGAAAAVGNFCQESDEDLDSTMYRAHPDASGGVTQALKSGGIGEWLGDRKLAYISFSEEQEKIQELTAGALLNDLDCQVDFTVKELTTNPAFKGLYSQLTTDTKRTLPTLVANFMRIYERPAEEYANLDNRINHGQAVYDRAQKIKASTGYQPVPIPTSSEQPISVPAIKPSSILPVPETTNLEVAILTGLNGIVKQYDARMTADQNRRDRFAKWAKDFESEFPESLPKELPKLVPSTSTKKESNMPPVIASLVERVLTNYLTTTWGTLGGLPSVLETINAISATGIGSVNWSRELPGIMMFIGGVLGKDAVFTSKPATPAK